MMILVRWMLFVGMVFPFFVIAQQIDTTVLILDDLQFDVKSVSVKADTASVEIFVGSLTKNPRDFKMNTYGSVIEDSKYNDHMYSSIEMGRVLVRIEDRQNYLNYLLSENKPVLIRFKVIGWKKEYGRPNALRLVFEDSKEEGRFREARVNIL